MTCLAQRCCRGILKLVALAEDQLEATHAIWDALADFPASEADAALMHLMECLSKLVAADNMIWVGAARIGHGVAARRDGQLGWRALVARHWRPGPTDHQITQRMIVDQDSEPSLTSQATARETGQWRIHRLRDGWIDMKAFQRTSHYRISYLARGITDRLFVGIPINQDAETIFLVDRYHDAPSFTPAQAKLVAYVMRGLKWFHRELMLSHGLLLAGAPLSPMQRRIVRLMLTDRTEKEIAAELGQSPKTTHKYITEICRRYGVRGRMGLMASWLNRQG